MRDMWQWAQATCQLTMLACLNFSLKQQVLLKGSKLAWVTRCGVKSEHISSNLVEDIDLEVVSLDTRRQGSKINSSGDEL